MDAAMYKALSGSVAQMHHLDVASQDLANVNTAGYKRQHAAAGKSQRVQMPDG